MRPIDIAWVVAGGLLGALILNLWRGIDTAPAPKLPDAKSEQRAAAPVAGATTTYAPPPGAQGFAAWPAVGLTVKANSALAPDGSNTAYMLIEDDRTGVRRAFATLHLNAGKPIAVSLSAKAGGRRRLLVRIAADHDQVLCDVDLMSGRTSVLRKGDAMPPACSAVDQGNGWWRVEVKGDLGHLRGTLPVFEVVPTIEPFADSYQGDGKGSIYVWNAAATQPVSQ